MAGLKALAKTQFAPEATPGTIASAIAVWRGPVAHIQDNREVTMVEEDIGVPVNTLRSYIAKEEAAISLPETPATFEQLPYVYEGAIQKVQAGTQDGAGTGYVYQYSIGSSVVRQPNTFTFKSGDNEGAEVMSYAFCQSFTLSAERNSAMMVSSDWLGRTSQASSFDSIGNVPTTVEEIMAPRCAVYIDGASVAFGTTRQNLTLLGANLSYETGFAPKYSIDSGSLVFGFVYFNKDSFSAELEMTYEHNASSINEKAEWRAQNVRNVRMDWTGNALGTSATYTNKLHRLDMTGKYSAFGALEDSDGNNTVVATLKIGYDAVADHVFTATVVNEIADLGVVS